jgi:hypothetical protein
MVHAGAGGSAGSSGKPGTGGGGDGAGANGVAGVAGGAGFGTGGGAGDEAGPGEGGGAGTSTDFCPATRPVSSTSCGLSYNDPDAVCVYGNETCTCFSPNLMHAPPLWNCIVTGPAD